MIKSRASAANWYEKVKIPLIIGPILFAVYCGTLHGGWEWFSYHPVSMIISSLSLIPLSVIIKKIGGVDNTILHGNIMIAAVALMAFGFYVIYSNKEAYGKQHLLTTHAQIGMAALVGLLGSSSAFGALHPTYGMLKTNKYVRMVHKWSSRVWTVAAWAACFTGFMTLSSSQPQQLAFGAVLIAMAPVFLL